jgi:DNA-binding transcriptional LysR family regulator
MRIDQLDGLVAFRCVAQSMSFTAAAAQLEVSPQAVSQAVKALETRLGVRLFHRTTRSVSLNEAGQRLWAKVGPALTDLFEATEAVQEFRDKPIGLLRIGISRPAFSAWLQPALAGFHHAYPDIKVELSFDDGFVDIVAQGLDAGVRLGDAVAQDMVSVKVTESEPIAVLGSPAYLQRRGVPQRVADLAGHDCIRFRFPSSGAVFRWELLEDGQPTEVEVSGVMTVNDTAAMLSCAAAGLGLAYVLEGTARLLIEDGSLVKVLAGSSPVLPGFHLYYPSRRQLPLKLRCFLDFMVARMQLPRPKQRQPKERSAGID